MIWRTCNNYALLWFAPDTDFLTVENINNLTWAYSNQGSLITIQVDQCRLWSVWLYLLLDYFLRSETDFYIYQSLQNRILKYVWFYKNSSSDITILVKSHFSILKFYNYSSTYSFCTIWWLDSAAVWTILLLRYMRFTPI